MRTSFTLSLIVVLFIAVSGAWGGAIAITNPSFESPSCGTTGPAFCMPTGWTNTGAASTAEGFRPPAGAWDSIPDGSQVAFSNGGTLTQTLSTDLAADTTYTLDVWVSGRSGSTFAPIIELLAGTNTLIDLTLSNPGGTIPTHNEDGTYAWELWTGIYTSGSSVPTGEALGISLSSTGIQSDFDNLSLSSSPAAPGTVPEPAVFALVGAGLLGLVTRRRFAK